MNIQDLVNASNEILKSEFKIIPKISKYKIHHSDSWIGFLRDTGAHPDSHGVYIPRSLSAHLKGYSEFLQVNLFHEFFGHGLFCEHAIRG